MTGAEVKSCEKKAAQKPAMTAAAKARGATRPGAEKNKASDSIPSDRGTARWLMHPATGGRAVTHATTGQPTQRASRELHDHRVDGEAVAGLGPDRFDDAVALRAQDVLHLPGFDHGHRLARLALP